MWKIITFTQNICFDSVCQVQTYKIQKYFIFSHEDLNNTKLYSFSLKHPIKNIDILSVENFFIHTKYLFDSVCNV